MAKSTDSKARRKPPKPYSGFPMFAHPSGQWSKKIRGKLKYFGVWNDPEAALERLNREFPYLSEGRTPPPVDTGDGCTLRNLANAFLRSKKRKLDAGELSPRSFRDYHQSCETVLTFFKKDRRIDDLRPDDFEDFRASLASRLGVSSLKNEINRCRVLFKFAHDQRLIKEPVAYGQSFNRPSAKALRRERNAAGPKLFSRDELLMILDAADPVMRAMALLGANAGFGNTNIASLPQSAIDFESNWVQHPRPKTEISRRIPLWAETIAALREAISKRPSPKNEADANLTCAFSLGKVARGSALSVGRRPKVNPTNPKPRSRSMPCLNGFQSCSRSSASTDVEGWVSTRSVTSSKRKPENRKIRLRSTA